MIRTLYASTVGEGLAPPENMNSNHKEREHQGAPLPTPTANANLILRRFASTRVFTLRAKIFARGSRERAPIALLAKCEPNSASLRSQSELRSDECPSQTEKPPNRVAFLFGWGTRIRT